MKFGVQHNHGGPSGGGITKLARGEICKLANTASKINGVDSQTPLSRNKSVCHGRLNAMAGLKGWQLVQTGRDDESDDVWQLVELTGSGAQQQTPAQPMPQESACCEKKMAESGAAKINNSEIDRNLLRRNDINRRVFEAFAKRIFAFKIVLAFC